MDNKMVKLQKDQFSLVLNEENFAIFKKDFDDTKVVIKNKKELGKNVALAVEILTMIGMTGVFFSILATKSPILSLFFIPLFASGVLASGFHDFFSKKISEDWRNKWGISFDTASAYLNPLSKKETIEFLRKVNEYGLLDNSIIMRFKKEKEFFGGWLSGHKKALNKMIEVIESETVSKEINALENGLNYNC